MGKGQFVRQNYRLLDSDETLIIIANLSSYENSETSYSQLHVHVCGTGGALFAGVNFSKIPFCLLQLGKWPSADLIFLSLLLIFCHEV